MKNWWKYLMALLAAALLALPVAGLVGVSSLEQALYAPSPPLELEALAYGELCQVERRDVPRRVTAEHCRVISTEQFFQELEDYDPYAIRFLAEVGQRVQAGDVIAYCDGEPILAERVGVIRRIGQGSDCYVLLDALDALALECYVDESEFDWRQEGLTLTRDGDAYTVRTIEDARYAGLGTRVVLESATAQLVYGQEEENAVFDTGQVFTDALVVDARCVYAYSGQEETYIRQVDGSGRYIAEIPVKTGYTDGKYVCISGVEQSVPEGIYCDAGYKSVAESS